MNLNKVVHEFVNIPFFWQDKLIFVSNEAKMNSHPTKMSSGLENSTILPKDHFCFRNSTSRLAQDRTFIFGLPDIVAVCLECSKNCAPLTVTFVVLSVLLTQF